MAVQGQVARQVRVEDLIELFRRLHEHLSGNVYCNLGGCIRLVYKCRKPVDPFEPCTDREPTVELYGYTENTVEELRQYARELELLRAEAETKTEFFRQGKTSLDQAKGAWTRYWLYVGMIERKLRESEKLLMIALGMPPEEEEDTGPCGGEDHDNN